MTWTTLNIWKRPWGLWILNQYRDQSEDLINQMQYVSYIKDTNNAILYSIKLSNIFFPFWLFSVLRFSKHLNQCQFVLSELIFKMALPWREDCMTNCYPQSDITSWFDQRRREVVQLSFISVWGSLNSSMWYHIVKALNNVLTHFI